MNKVKGAKTSVVLLAKYPSAEAKGPVPWQVSNPFPQDLFAPFISMKTCWTPCVVNQCIPAAGATPDRHFTLHRFYSKTYGCIFWPAARSIYSILCKMFNIELNVVVFGSQLSLFIYIYIYITTGDKIVSLYILQTSIPDHQKETWSIPHALKTENVRWLTTTTGMQPQLVKYTAALKLPTVHQ